MHTVEVEPKGSQRANIEKIQTAFENSEAEKSPKRDPQTGLNEGDSSKLLVDDERMEDQESITTSIVEEKTVDCEDLNLASGDACEDLNRDSGDAFEKSLRGVLWDVFRREDVPKLIEYLRVHWNEFQKPANIINNSVRLFAFRASLIKKLESD